MPVLFHSRADFTQAIFSRIGLTRVGFSRAIEMARYHECAVLPDGCIPKHFRFENTSQNAKLFPTHPSEGRRTRDSEPFQWLVKNRRVSNHFVKAVGIATVLLLHCFVALPCHAQEPAPQVPTPAQLQPQPTPRRKIGLALGGGAALGIAHAGVLQWLEEHRIPVDAIAGTSMGGLVAGAYATGMSAEEVRALLEEQSWNRTLAAETSYQALAFRRKEDRREYPSTLQFSLRGSAFPVGVNPAPRVALLLSRIAARVGPVQSFDELPIPFRCVAVDLRTGNTVVLKDGSLATALRATMAIPGLFTPVEQNGQLLIDGGVVDNVPAGVAKSLGPDVVIAVDVVGRFTKQQSFGGLTDVLNRTLGLLTRRANEQGLRAADVVLRPDLEAYTTLDWFAGPDLIKRGYDTAEANKEKLLPFALSEDEWQAHLAARRARLRTEAWVPRFVEVRGAGGRQAQGLQQRLRRFVGKPLDTNELESALTLFSGNGTFASLQYAPVERNGRTGLRILAQPNVYAPPTISIAPVISTDRPRNVQTLLTGRLTLADVGLLNSETRVDVAVGSAQSFQAEYFAPLPVLPQALDAQVFVAPRAFYRDAIQPVIERGTRTADYLIRARGVGADLGLIYGRRTEVRAGYETGTQSANVFVGDTGLPAISGTINRYRLRYTYDGQDAPVVPRRGLRVLANAEQIVKAPQSSGAYNRYEVATSLFASPTLSDTFFLAGSAGTISSRTFSPLSEFSLGGILRLSAYQPGEFLGRNAVYGTVGYLRQISPGNFVLGGRTSLGAWVEAGKASGSRTVQNNNFTPFCLSGGVLIETPVGPILAGASVSQRGNARAFFSLGRFLY